MCASSSLSGSESDSSGGAWRQGAPEKRVAPGTAQGAEQIVDGPLNRLTLLRLGLARLRSHFFGPRRLVQKHLLGS